MLRANPNADINQTLLAWYLSHPILFGGMDMPDISGNGHDAVWHDASDMQDVVPNWTTETHTGGFASVKKGIDDPSLRIANPINIFPGSDLTMAAWFRHTGVASNQPADVIGGRDTGLPILFRLHGTNGTGDVFPRIQWDNTAVLDPASGYFVPQDIWTRCVWSVQSGTIAKFYADGVLKHSAAHSVVTPAFSIAKIQEASTGDNVPGWTDDYRFESRVWSDSDAMADYQDSLASYPKALLRQLPAPLAMGMI